MELAAYLNDTGLLLQAVVQCYGLLAPLLHFKLPSLPVVQVGHNPSQQLLLHIEILGHIAALGTGGRGRN